MQLGHVLRPSASRLLGRTSRQSTNKAYCQVEGTLLNSQERSSEQDKPSTVIKPEHSVYMKRARHCRSLPGYCVCSA